MHVLAAEGRYLDPRPAAVAAAAPCQLAVNIPVEEILSRLFELPEKGEEVLVALAEPYSSEALRILREGGRAARAIEVPPAVRAESFRLWKPNPFLAGVLRKAPVGRALDLGCGSGRETVAMAAAGHRVVACDRLPDALEKGSELAGRYLPPSETGRIRWVRVDLESEGPPPGTWDLIVSIRYLHRPLLARAYDLLAPRGCLVVETFTVLHRERHGKPGSDDHVLRLGELPSLAPGLRTVLAEEGWRGESHTGSLWAVKE